MGRGERRKEGETQVMRARAASAKIRDQYRGAKSYLLSGRAHEGAHLLAVS